MQRAAVSSPTSPSSATQTPAAEPSAKRRRIDSSSLPSPASSALATPTNGTPVSTGHATPATMAQNSGLVLPARGGRSTFDRFEGADTEWVLDIKPVPPVDSKDKSTPSKKTRSQINVNGVDGSSRFSALAEQRHDESDEDEDIWDTKAQPSGRQTFGSFKKKNKTRHSDATTGQHAGQDDDEEEENSASDSESGEVSDSDSSSSNPRYRKTQTPTSTRKSQRPSKDPQDVDSDEEMRRVRAAIEQKHRNMSGVGAGGGGGYNHKSFKPGQKRKGRDDGRYKSQKKARKTI